MSASTPDRLPVLPLRDVVIFPHVVMPLLIGRPSSLAAVEVAAAQDRLILLVAQRDGELQEPAAADLFRVGVVARIVQLSRLPNGTTKVLVEGLARARVTRYSPAGPLLKATVDFTPEAAEPPAEATQALGRRMLSLFEEYVSLHRRIPTEVATIVQSAEGLERQAFGVAAHVSTRLELRQQLLESPNVEALLEQLIALLTAELDLLKLERKLEDQVRGSLVQNQREFYLQEQLKAIHRELGQDEGDDLATMETQIAAKGMPEAVEARALRELRKLRRTSPVSPESAVTRGYLEWLLALPWRERTDDVLDVAHARQVLDEDHHGLEDVKDRILDYIAALQVAGRLDGPILCLVGPPGVGKTSLGRSIARALGRKFVRMSLGGVRDEAEIRGHRRTYVGALPGRVIQAMRRAGVVNPVILLDEVDKLGQDYRGDPSAALLEVLDPEQHRAFNDHYLEVDYDLSQVLFVTTANYLPQIPEPLRDRMEIIRLSGYLETEKHAIARRFLIPKQLEQHGLAPSQVHFDDDVVPAIVRGYTREAGVRELERRVARVARKLARRVAEGASGVGSGERGVEDRAKASVGARGAPPNYNDAAAPAGQRNHSGAHGADSPLPPLATPHSPLTVRLSDLHELLGTAPYDPDALSLEAKVGVVTGLAYTSSGGEVLEIEVSALPGRGKLQLTGTLGDVMKESASAALSYARTRAAALGLEVDFYRTRDLHLHIPAGATPKDGPSAGIAIATAILSALTGIAVRGDVAMTGEITLRGRVLPIGGLKEKAVAAHRNRVAHIIIPEGNLRDVEEIPAEVRDAVTIHPVRSMDEVLALALVRDPIARAERSGASGAPVGLVAH